MDYKLVRDAIKKKRYKVFVGSEVTLSEGTSVLFEDILAVCQRMLAYQRDITPDAVKDVYPILTAAPRGFTITWVKIWGPNGNLLDADGDSFEDGIQREIVEKLALATKEAVMAIDIGNDLAIESIHELLSASKAKSRCEAGPNPAMSARVGWRASGQQIPFAFAQAIKEIGGVAGAHDKFTNPEKIKLEGCILVKWMSLSSVELELVAESIPPAIVKHLRMGKPRIQAIVSAVDVDIMRGAWLAGCPIDIDVSRGLNLEGYTDVLHLRHVHDWAGIIKAVGAKLDEMHRAPPNS